MERMEDTKILLKHNLAGKTGSGRPEKRWKD
jgi:hypothetical protein